MLFSRNPIGWLSLTAVVCAGPAFATERYAPVAVSGQAVPGVTGFEYDDFGLPSVNRTGQVAFAAETYETAEPTHSGSGVWVGAPGDVAVVAATGLSPTGLAEAFTNFTVYSTRATPINEAGEVLFVANAATPDEPPGSYQDFWKGNTQTTSRLYRSGDAALEAGEDIYLTNFSNAINLLNDNGDVAFTPWLSDYSGQSVELHRAFWRTPAGSGRQLLGAEDPVGGPVGVAPIPNYYAGSLPVMTSNGDAIFLARAPTNAAYSSPIAVVRATASGVEILATAGEAAPGVEGATLQGISLHDASDSGVLVNTALSDGRSGLWVLGGEGLEPRVITGETFIGAAPGEKIGSFFYGGAINSRGVVSAFGRIDSEPPSTLDTGVWLSDSAGARLIAREGDPAPGTDGVFNRFIRSEPILNSRGQVAFLGAVSGESLFSGLWATAPDGELVLVVKSGDEIEVSPGDTRTISLLRLPTQTGGEDGRPSPFNDIGQLVFTATFTDGSSAVILSEEVAQLDADYNGDGAVDPEDYTVWREAYGSSLVAADGNGDGVVDAADYSLWRDQFGARLFTSPTGAAVPEPTAMVIALALAGWLPSRRFRG